MSYFVLFLKVKKITMDYHYLMNFKPTYEKKICKAHLVVGHHYHHDDLKRLKIESKIGLNFILLLNYQL